MATDLTRYRSRSRYRVVVALLLALGASAIETRAVADPTAADRETARALMSAGDKKFANKDYAGALKAYEGAHAIMSVASTGEALARTQAALGLLVEARDTAISVTRMELKANAPVAFVKARAAAEKLVRDLEARIPSVQIDVEGPPQGADITVTIDDQPVPSPALKLPRKADPGKHVLHASVAGFTPASSEVTLVEGQNASVTLALSRAAAPPEAPPAVGTRLAASGSVFEGAGGEVAPRRTSPFVFVGFGVGAAGVLTGAITGVMHLSKVSSVKNDYCSGGTACRAGFEGPASDAKVLGTVSTIGFAAGAVGIGVGVVALVASPGSSSLSGSGTLTPREARWAPVVGLGSVGLRGTF
jgi:hypothetical protein